MHKLKEVVSRGAAFVAAMALLTGIGTSVVPSLVSADALNPLTERTLLLSSSAPGYVDTDGSGNATYAPPNSGANGRKSGETYTFKTSTPGSTTPIKAFTFQFCTTAAGLCQAPGDDSGNALDSTPDRGNDVLTGASPTSDLNVVVGNGTTTVAPSEVTAIPSNTDPTYPGIVNPDGSQGTFGVEYSTDNGSTWTLDPNWTMSSSNLEDSATTQTGKNNYITLVRSTGSINQPAGTEIKVVFYGTNDDYITNPGADAFFVKINDYDSTTLQNFRDNYPTNGQTQNVIDGGVTVANVMNQSIQIHTKVLETLEFSVGTYDPDTGTASHGPCDGITYGPNNDSVITLGNPNAEDALEVNAAHNSWSFWRLSSNSSNGATVYYSGNTLANTEGDHIGQIYDLSGGHTAGDNSAEYSHTGSEQFGLGIDVTDTSGRYVDAYNDNTGAATDPAAPALDTSWTSAVTSNNPGGDPGNTWHNPQLYPLVPMGDATDDPNGTLSYGVAHGSITTNGAGARFAFSKTANTIPVPIASESTQVVNCSTGLMRYIGNIAATTPAGIYTTSVDYLAAPEY